MRFVLFVLLAACSSSSSSSKPAPVAANTPPAPTPVVADESPCCCEFEEGDGIDTESRVQLDWRATCLAREGASCIALDRCDEGQEMHLDERKMGKKGEGVPGKDYRP